MLPDQNPSVAVKPENQSYSRCVTCARCRAQQRQARAERLRRLEHEFRRGLMRPPVPAPEPPVIIISSDSEEAEPEPVRLHRTQRFRL